MYISDDIRRLRKCMIFDRFLHTLYGWGAPIEDILIIFLRRLYYIVADDIHCRRMVGGRPMDEFKVVVAIATVDRVFFLFLDAHHN